MNCGFANAAVFSLRGSCLQSLEWGLDAIEDFTKAISLEPQNGGLYFQRAMAQISVGDMISFEADLREAIRVSHVVNASNRNHDEGARQLGWANAAAMYRSYSVLASETRDFIVVKNSERAKLRGKRRMNQDVG